MIFLFVIQNTECIKVMFAHYNMFWESHNKCSFCDQIKPLKCFNHSALVALTETMMLPTW